MPSPLSRPGPRPTLRLLALRFGVMLLPILLLALAALRAGKQNQPQFIFWAGTVFQMGLSLLVLRSRRLGRNPLGSAVLVMYVVALAWLALGQGVAQQTGWYPRFAQGMLFLIGMLFFARLVIIESGLRARYEAGMLALRLADRTDWPANLEECKALPELREFREALGPDPTPAFSLLANPRPQARLAGLVALEGKRDWMPGQAEMVVEVVRRAAEPPVRGTALRVLAGVPDRRNVEAAAEYLRDPAPEVRRAALEIFRWHAAERWPWIRDAVREALSQAQLQGDGPLLPEGVSLPPEAVKDLKAWIAERGVLAVRSTLTLVAHYDRLLVEQRDEKLIHDLKKELLDSHTPAILRIELAQLLEDRQVLDRPTHEKLLDPINSAPLRVLAADALLRDGSHAGALTALRDVARMPNRDIALATADVVQRRLGVDLGLIAGQPLPSVTSRQAADITRKVMAWARESDATDDAPTDTKILLH